METGDGFIKGLQIASFAVTVTNVTIYYECLWIKIERKKKKRISSKYLRLLTIGGYGAVVTQSKPKNLNEA